MAKIKCCICGKEIEEIGSNNPFPYKTEGRCCNDCNMKHVIPARMADIHGLIHSNPQTKPCAQAALKKTRNKKEETKK